MKFVIERRRYKRIFYSLPLQYRNLDERYAHAGFTKNISEGGVKFISYRFIPVATNLDLTLNTPSSPRPLRVSSKVLWIREASTGEYYEVGLCFTSLKKEEEKRKLKDIVESFDKKVL